jgi:hypothetical protein
MQNIGIGIYQRSTTGVTESSGWVVLLKPYRGGFRTCVVGWMCDNMDQCRYDTNMYGSLFLGISPVSHEFSQQYYRMAMIPHIVL